MSSGFKLTKIEQMVLNEVRQMLGPNLADYLLSGLGETNTIHYRAFTAVSASSQAERLTYRLEVRNDYSHKGLPKERDPLVMAALITVLRERQPLDSRITFRDLDILEKLQWVSKPESRILIRQALDRYFLTAYYLIDTGVEMNEQSNDQCASAKRLLIGYETASALLPVKRTKEQGLTRVQFLPEFSYDSLFKKRFFGVNFEMLQEMQEVTC